MVASWSVVRITSSVHRAVSQFSEMLTVRKAFHHRRMIVRKAEALLKELQEVG